ncbi:MAG: hypothetical protein ACFFG0_39690 [Candidatus Thorarchaeota archaeon]
MFVLKDNKLIKIPNDSEIDSETNLANWLDDNSFSKNDKIIVLLKHDPSRGHPKYEKVNWVPEIYPSPYYLDFDIFRNELKGILGGLDVIINPNWEGVS